MENTINRLKDLNSKGLLDSLVFDIEEVEGGHIIYYTDKFGEFVEFETEPVLNIFI